MEGLRGVCRADAVIVGCGVTGLLLGASLGQAGLRIVIVEAGSKTPALWDGAMLSPAMLAHTEAQQGTEAARQYTLALQEQLSALLSVSPSYVQKTPLYLFARTSAALPMLFEQQDLCRRLNIPVFSAPDAGGCPFPVESSLCLPDAAAVDGSRWSKALSGFIRHSGGRICLDSRVIALEDHQVLTAHGCVRADITILLTGVPLCLRGPLLPLLHSRTHALLPLRGIPLHTLQQDVQGGMRFCPAPGGAAAALDAGPSGTRREALALTAAQELTQRLLMDYHQEDAQYVRTVHAADGLPFIGALPDGRLIVAGLGSSGIPGAMHAAALLTRHILGRPQPQDALYSPRRSVSPLLLRQANRRARWLRWRSRGQLHSPACSHCGCRLRYTEPISLFECPLCGSAYTAFGEPAAAPCTDPVSIKRSPY